MASSEFILAPRIDEAKARQEMQKLDDVARRTAQQMSMEFEDAWDNFDKRGHKSLKKLSFELQGFMGSMAGNLAANAIAKVGEVAIDAATRALQELESTKQTARERYEQNRDISNEADALGIGRGKYAALDIAGVASGLDQSDMRGLLSGFVGSLAKPEMEKFRQDANKHGIDKAFLDFIGSTSKLKPEEAAQRMNEVFGDDDALKASKFMKPIQDLMKTGKDLNFQNIVDNMAGRHVDIKGLEKALNMSEEQMKDLFSNDARLLEEHIKGVAEQDNAKLIATSDNSTDSVINAHLKNLHVKVEGQLIADGITKAEISTSSAMITSATPIAKTITSSVKADIKRTQDLLGALNAPAFEAESYGKLAKALISWTNNDPNAPMPKKNESAMDYFNRNQAYKDSILQKSLVEQHEQDVRDNKTRTDTGPLK